MTTANTQTIVAPSRVAAFLMAATPLAFLNAHDFYIGRTNRGILGLLAFPITFFGVWVVSLFGLEGFAESALGIACLFPALLRSLLVLTDPLEIIATSERDWIRKYGREL